MTDILTRHGSFTQISTKFSYINKNNFVANPSDCFRRESPSLVRIDVTYGRGSSASWLFSVLQGMFVFLGVTEERFSKEQIYNLACNISANYKTLKLAEILLFVSRFEAGKYGKFYGDTSYALTVADALNTFMEERAIFYSNLEQEKAARKLEGDKENVVSFEEYKKMKEARGEKVSDALNNLFGNNP